MPSKRFDDWLTGTMQAEPQKRSQRLCNWDLVPAARIADLRKEHLLPLMVVVGSAEKERASRVFYEEVFMDSASVSSWRLG